MLLTHRRRRPTMASDDHLSRGSAMPLYEYSCHHCEIKFELLRPFSKADAPASCPHCDGQDTKRAISRFASFSRSADGSTSAHGGGGGCAGCPSHSCAGCSR
ncbi:MAG: FmdB family zinc ribbon protein [Anaerolineae bacterium]